MRSSTSSSEPHGLLSYATRHRRAWTLALATVLTFAGCVLAGWAGWTHTSASAYLMDVVTAEDPPSDHYLAHARGGHVDHHVLYHGIDAASLEAMRRADVLLMGNSRLMFALRGDALRQYFLPRGLRAFALGFGHLEQHEVPLAIFRRFDLHPRVVIVNVDNFFGGMPSPWAQRVMREDAFDAWKVRIEATAAYRTRRVLHRVVPHVPELWLEHREFLIHRSRRDGSWFLGTRFGRGLPLMDFYEGRDALRPHNVALARAFKQTVEAAGARLIFVLVPGRDVSLTAAQMLAGELDVPLVVPRVEGLRSMDASHLTDESAARYALAFFRELDPVLDAVLGSGLPGAGRGGQVSRPPTAGSGPAAGGPET